MKVYCLMFSVCLVAAAKVDSGAYQNVGVTPLINDCYKEDG